MKCCCLPVKTFSRGNPSSAVKAAAYRSGERLRDERSDAVFDCANRADVAHAEIIIRQRLLMRRFVGLRQQDVSNRKTTP